MNVKLKYVLCLIGAVLITLTPLLSHPAAAAMPLEIRKCLETKPDSVSPTHYLEIAKVRVGVKMYYYLNVMYPGDTLPSGQVLLSSQNGSCQSLIGIPSLTTSIMPYLPKDAAIYLAERKWQAMLSFPGGKQYLGAVLRPSVSINEMGEALGPMPVLPEDVLALHKMGYRVAPRDPNANYGG